MVTDQFSQPRADIAYQRQSSQLPTVLMVGGGQLARMTHQAAIALGQSLRVLAASPEESAALICRDVVLGRHDDLEALRKAADGATVLTFDHEHVPPGHLETLISEGVNVQPPPTALIHAQDKLVMREKLASIGAPVPPFAAVDSAADVTAFGAEHGFPVVVKATRGGYDGKGVWVAETADEAAKIVSDQLAAGVSLLVEEKVDMRRELSAMVAHSPFGQGATWPVVETVQRNGVCAVVIAPAPELPTARASEAQQLALRIAEELGVTGCLAVELFETSDGRILVNELAMRPHNSGHWTMDGARTSQFEQHVRAVLDYPLGDTSPTAPVTVMANVLGAAEPPAMSMDERVHHLCARMPDAKVHLYGKGERAGRKLGHVNVLGAPGGSPDDTEYVESVRNRAELAAHWLSHGVWADGWNSHTATFEEQ
ncbi:5-(carboxyamino)imidazole ribonucleotide synthase [Hoyosella altamirensis]|uniref:N5-carboxyaminoimidazole ribonucleotide synthase n=1 Tax=Hoyosella altamirensis TaxID=616997 RepID=A0A839RGS5_9ACTN|nr:5-(carboxyamino)imidazole ribonucleotide synthase [Hoyosella altamirensis]